MQVFKYGGGTAGQLLRAALGPRVRRVGRVWQEVTRELIYRGMGGQSVFHEDAFRGLHKCYAISMTNAAPLLQRTAD